MLYVRNEDQRGRANFGWLDSKHSFSFGHYYDRKHMGFSALRVINDDTVIPGAGFDTHGHRDMEIISYVLDGVIEHKDSMGKHSVLPAGEVQRMSAGTGVTHSEFNSSRTEKLRFLQIWIQPRVKGVKPSYEQRAIKQDGKLTALVTPSGEGNSLSINQDASMYRLKLNEGESYLFDTIKRPGYLHVIEGDLTVNESAMQAGDAIGAYQEKLSVKARTPLTALWFDLPNWDVK